MHEVGDRQDVLEDHEETRSAPTGPQTPVDAQDTDGRLGRSLFTLPIMIQQNLSTGYIYKKTKKKLLIFRKK